MNLKRLKPHVLVAVLVTVLMTFLSCQNLDTVNLNQPDTERALSTPEDVESLIQGSLVAWFRAHNRWGVEHLAVMADALTWSWGNYSGQDMSSEPRIAYPNNTSYRYQNALQLPWERMYAAISAASDGIRQINANEEEFSRVIDTHRAKAMAKLAQGLAMGYLACFFDRAFILDENTDLEEVGKTLSFDDYKPYTEVMDAALKMLDDAIALFEGGPAFTAGSDWFNGLELTNEDLAKIAHSYVARYMAQVARTPAERQAVDWNAVMAHLQKGIDVDFAPHGDGSFSDWWHSNQWFHNDRGASWGRLDYKMIGGADESDGYQTWLDTPVQLRTEFDMVTSDKRLTGLTLQNYAGEDVDGGIYAGNWGPSPFRANRGTYHFSKYGYYRYENFGLSGNQGPMPVYLVAEKDFLMAEAFLHTGQGDAAAALIDKYHVTNGGYPSAAGAPIGNITDPKDPKPGASLWSILKYEKQIECLQTGAGLEYFDNRGWGDLVTNTPIHAPVPAKELEILQVPTYTFGGGGEGSAPKVNLGPPAPPR